MIRAIFFDFYSVWTPDRLGYYLAKAELAGPIVAKEVSDLIEAYYHGQGDISYLASSLKAKLLDASISPEEFQLSEASIAPQITELMRSLHEHFIKLGVLANLGVQEYGLLVNFNDHNQVLEVIASPYAYEMAEPLLSGPVFGRAMQEIGEPPENCLYVSGNLASIEFASAMGLNTLQFEGLPRLEESLNTLTASGS